MKTTRFGAQGKENFIRSLDFEYDCLETDTYVL